MNHKLLRIYQQAEAATTRKQSLKLIKKAFKAHQKEAYRLFCKELETDT